MINSHLLRSKISESGIKLYALASRLGLSGYGLSRKIDNKTEFKASEIEKLCDILQLSTCDRDGIFFGSCVDFKATKGRSKGGAI